MRTIVGKVTSIKMNQTAVVQVDRNVTHPRYFKLMRRSTKYHAHVTIPVEVGDAVKMIQIKPVSKTKHWQITEVAKQ